MSIFNKILENVEKGEYSNILGLIDSSKLLNDVILDFINNIEYINIRKIEPILKVILNKILHFNGLKNCKIFIFEI